MSSLRTYFIPIIGAAAIAGCAGSQDRQAQMAERQAAPELEARVYQESRDPAMQPMEPQVMEEQMRQQEMEQQRRAEMSQTPRAGEMLAADKGFCPIDVENAQTQVRGANGSVVLVVTTSENNVDELRQRARDWSARTSQFTPAMAGQMGESAMMEHEGAMMGQEEMRQHQLGMSSSSMPVRISVQDVSGGILLVMTPQDPAQLAQLEQTVHEESRYLGQGRCPIGERLTTMIP